MTTTPTRLERPRPVPLDALIDMFVGTPYAETTAALHVVAALLPTSSMPPGSAAPW